MTIYDGLPDWSPDGTQIVFGSDRSWHQPKFGSWLLTEVMQAA